MKPIIVDKEFEKAAQEMIAGNRHRDFMSAAMQEYREYQQFMSNAFLEEATDDVLTIRAKYRWKKSVWREMEIMGTQTLADLASCIIESMDWMEDHLHGFWFPDKRKNRIYGDYGIFHKAMEDEPFIKLKTQDISVAQIDWQHYPILGFVFDFGDGHEFDVILKSARKREKRDTKRCIPALVDQRGVAPEQYPELEDEKNEDTNSRI